MNYIIFKNKLFKIVKDREWSENFRCFYIELIHQKDVDFINYDYYLTLNENTGKYEGNDSEKESYVIIDNIIKSVYNTKVVGIDADIVSYEVIGMIRYSAIKELGPIKSKKILIQLETLKTIDKFCL